MTTFSISCQSIASGYGGSTQIKGTITKLGVAVNRRWACLDRISLKIIAIGRSDDSGNYFIRYLRYFPNRYLMFAIDDLIDSGTLNAAVADLITPEPIT